MGNSKKLLNRNIESYLHSWIGRTDRLPIIIRGARQVGKSTSIQKFAHSISRTLFEINLERHVYLDAVFATMDTGKIFQELELIVKQGPLRSHHDILFLDELQATPHAIAALRYLYEDRPDLPIIAAGSLLEFTLSQHSFSMPVGRVEYCYMGPMLFDEYLAAAGQQQLISYLNTFNRVEDASVSAHNQLCSHLRDYLLIGGMPRPVSRFLSTRDMREVNRQHRIILDTYSDDFGKYGSKNQIPKLRSVFSHVPTAVGNKFKYSKVNTHWKSSDIHEAVTLLSQARVIAQVFHTDAGGAPLGATINEKVFKPLFLDVGLMNASLGVQGIPIAEFESKRFINEGSMAEQCIGQHLLYGNDFFVQPHIFYWLREGKKNNAEVDYVIQVGTTIVPCEVKCGTSGSLRSLHQFIAGHNANFALRFDLNPPSAQDCRHTVITPGGAKEIHFRLLSLPLYMAHLANRLCEKYL
ncbi:MAG: AAA family ATPase [Chitinivibrionales bacterium]|nr:AAA family ATPase [Chitinivibrionales bacterium]